MFTFSTHPLGGAVIDRLLSLVKSLLGGWTFFFFLTDGMLVLDAEFHRALPLHILKDAWEYRAGKRGGISKLHNVLLASQPFHHISILSYIT